MSAAAIVDPEVLAASRAVLAEHARTFDLAGAFLEPPHLAAAAVVYAVCRLIDDAVDEAATIDEGRAALAEIEAELAGADPRPLIVGLRALAADRGIDLQVFHELCAGVRSDAGAVRIADDGELVRYCYRVAGTVGLMMCGVMEIRDPAAFPFAVDLGIGMQITNICRDVAEDAVRGRIYVPEARLRARAIDPAQLLDGTVDRARLAPIVGDLLGLAERYYSSAELGMRWIPRRSRLAIMIASRVYRAIGRRLRRRGGDPMRGRVVVPGAVKGLWVGQATLAWLGRDPRVGEWGPVHDPWLHAALAGVPGADPRAGVLQGRLWAVS